MSDKRTVEQRLTQVEGELSSTRRSVRRGLKAMLFAGVVFVLAAAATAWQIDNAFDEIDEQRIERIGASASINVFLCQRIDSVGNGVASLVRVSLAGVKDPDALPPNQRDSYDRFLSYAEDQERPPRCRELALKIATLTGADPGDVKLTPIQLHSPKRDVDRRRVGPGE